MLRERWGLLIALLLAMPAALSAQSAGGSGSGGLTVAPVQLSLAANGRGVSTVVTNPGSRSITVQVRLYSWTMRGEEEVYAPASDVGFSPPLFRLEPGAAQAVRIVARVPPGTVERSYRLVVDQLPLPDAPGQLQLPVRMVLPVFLEPAPGEPRNPELGWSARYEPAGHRMVVTVVNRGSMHARIVHLRAEDAQGASSIAQGLAGYALAGQSRQWSYQPEHAPGDTITIIAEGGPTPIRVTVPVTR